jgi:hypothetical protein
MLVHAVRTIDKLDLCHCQHVSTNVKVV